ncbi:unnamed protein product [Closterium sp. NIES-54]
MKPDDPVDGPPQSAAAVAAAAVAAATAASSAPRERVESAGERVVSPRMKPDDPVDGPPQSAAAVPAAAVAAATAASSAPRSVASSGVDNCFQSRMASWDFGTATGTMKPTEALRLVVLFSHSPKPRMLSYPLLSSPQYSFRIPPCSPQALVHGELGLWHGYRHHEAH